MTSSSHSGVRCGKGVRALESSAHFGDPSSMSESNLTCWTMVEGAARGDAGARAWFAAEYGPLIARYLSVRWAGTRRMQEIEDASQEVFLECYRDGGVLARADRDRGASFRGFLLGAVRNVARRIEARAPREARETPLDPAAPENASDEASLSVVFDRAWAKKIMAEAAREQREVARNAVSEETVGGAERRVELLRLRFQEDRPIRAIAAEWGEDPAHLHRQYALAREEFRRALFTVLARYQGGDASNLEQECAFLLSLLTAR